MSYTSGRTILKPHNGRFRTRDNTLQLLMEQELKEPRAILRCSDRLVDTIVDRHSPPRILDTSLMTVDTDHIVQHGAPQVIGPAPYTP